MLPSSHLKGIDHYASRFGFWRGYVTKVIHRYLACGDLHFGFARVKYEACGHEYLAFSCKRRHFFPSCHQKRVVEYSEWLLGNVLKEISHQQWVLSIPKRLRIYFLYDRKLLSKLSKCAWNVIRAYHKSATLDENATPGASIAVHTYGDFLNFNPHIHAIVPDGYFLEGGGFSQERNEMSTQEWRQNWARLIQKVGACSGLDSGRRILSYARSARGK